MATDNTKITTDATSAEPNRTLTDVEAKQFLATAPKTPLFNRTTKKSEFLPYEQLTDAIKSGSHYYAKGTNLFVKDPESGKTYEVPAEELQDTLANTSFKLESPKESAVREYLNRPENKGLSGAAQVALRSALDEFTFGASGAAEQYSADPLDLEKREALAEKNKIADYGGAALGLIGGIGATSGLNIGTKGLKAASKLLSKEVAEKAGQKVTEKAAEGIIKNAATKAAEFGIEGVAYATPKALTETAFGDYDAAATSLLAGGAFGSLFGAGWGGGSAALGKAKTLATNYLRDADRAKATAYNLLGANAERRTQIQLSNPNADEYIVDYVNDLADSTPGILKSEKKLVEAMKAKTVAADARVDEIARKIDEVATSKLTTADDLTRTEIMSSYPDIAKITREVDEQVISPLTINGGEAAAGYTKDVQKAREFLSGLTEETQKRYGSTQPTTLRGLIDMKRRVDGLIRYGDQVESTLLNDALKATRGKIDDYIKLEMLPKVEAGLLRDHPELAGMADDFIRANLDSSMGRTFERTALKAANKADMPASSIKMADLFIGTVTKNAVDAAQVYGLKEMVKAGKRYAEQQNLLSVNKALLNQAKAINGIPEVLSGKTPFKRAAEAAGLGVRVKMGQGAREAIQQVFGIDDAPTNSSLNNEELYKKISDKISELDASPEATTEKISAITSPMAEMGAPRLAASVNGYMLNTAQYVRDMLPKPQTLGNPIFKQKAYIPSDRDMYKFARKLEVVNDPMVLVRNLKDGTLSQDEVQVAADLYPNVLNKIQTKVMDYLAISDAIIPYSERLKYALLLGIDADSSTDPSTIASLQQTYATYLDNPPPQGTTSTPSNNYKVEDLETATGRITRS